MAVYKIYHKDGSILSDANGKEIEVHSIEYNGTWMGECFVTVTFENEAPISFSIGDYIEYRGERFEINYDPGKIKCASKGSYGGAFKYDSVKFNALSDELVRCDMLDLVLYDNNLHYTALPQFAFYVESLDDLLDRIQANLDELYGKAVWKLYSRNKECSIQRGCTAEGWESAYGAGTTDNVIDSTSISISDQNCWDALSLVNSKFDVNFIIRDRNVYVGTAGVPTANIFKYGKDKGLYEIEQNSESDQAIVTRLRAYGSNRNLPNHYYADLGSIPFLNITGDYHDGSTDSGLSVMMEDSVYAGMFTDIISDNGSNMKHCRIRGSIDGYEFDGVVELVKKDSTKSTTRLLVEGKAVCDAIKAKIDAGIVQVDFISGANKTKFNGNRINYVSNLPNNMACDRLMLPGFPNKSLSEWWNEQSEAKKAWLNPGGKGHDFSVNRHRPYVDSLNIDSIGVRPASVFFDQDDKVNGIVEIYPTIEGMEVDGVRIDEIYMGTNIEDDGRFGDGETVANVPIYLSPKVNFDIRALMQEDFTIHMKDGMCAGREFKVAGCTKEKDGSWKLMIERKPDDSLNLYFPYNDFQIKKGDHFVLSGIELPDAYVEAASEKLLRYCIAYLDKNDYTRYVYQPKVDEIFMARQHDTAMADASGLTKSLYLTLKEGDIMLFKDDDLGIDAEITIDQLTIKEEDGKIPTYEITLREEKEVGTIQKIQNQISSITNGNGGSFTGGTGGGGLSSSQIKNLIDAIGSDRFLSKLNPDTAAGVITFLQGTNWGNFTSETGAAMTVDPNTGQTYMEVDRLKVRLKAFFEKLEIQKVGFVGGKLIVTKGQGVDILDVENIYDSEGNVSAYRCYFLGEQEGRKIDNLLRVKDQMICKDFNVSEGSTDGATNKYYWRLVTAVSSDVVKRGNYVCHWVDLSATDCDTNSDIPEIGDTICHLGNREDTDRQGAEILSVVDANSPSFTIYSGINSYSLVNKEYIDMGVAGGKAFCNIYGSTYIGDRNRENGYISWDYDKEENVWKMRVKGTIDISSPLSSGGTIGGAITDAANAYKGEFNNFVNNTYAEDKKDFYNQLDGKVETWYQKDDPKDKWAAADYSKHKGDIWYNDSENKSYRWTGTAWVELKDQAAIDAKTLAESKKRVFTTTALPTPPYDKKDLWVQGENGDIMVCVKEKTAGETASASDWAKASKYTDDTKAKEALTKVGDLQTDVTELGDSINTLTNTTLPALSDGIITTSEKENIRQALMQVQKECVDVINAYTNLTVNYKSIYDNIAANVRTDFATAYTNLMGSATLSSDGTITYTSGQGGAYGALVDNINALLNKEGNLTTNEIATINNNIANFNIKYNDFQNRLVVVRNDIEKTLDTRITKVDEQLGGYAYLKKIVGGKTTIDGGLVLTTMLGTGYEVTGGAYKIMSGISGLYETAKSVAIWAGGSMIDKFVYYDAENKKFNVPDDVTPANFLVRMDGTGYAAGGNFWWDNDGKIHADPQSFLINEQYVGNVMQLFQLHYKVAGDTAFTNVDYVTPTRMFNGLELSDLGLKIGDTAKFYIKDGVLFLEGDLAVTGGITMYASDGVKSGMIDQVYAVLDQSLFSIVDGVITITGEIGSGTVKGITINSTKYDPDANGIIALTLNWGDLTGVPTTFTPSAHNHDDRYYTESEIDTKLGLKLDTSLKGAADGIATLDSSGKVPSSQLPSYVDDVLEYANKASFPTKGESGKIYIDKETNLTYRWGGTAYVEISQSLALGETSSTAYAGDKGKQNATDIAALKTGKADKATTLAGYGITDAYTKTQTYTQAEVNTKLTDGSVTKVGKVDVGSATKPIYLKAGVPTAVGTSLAVDITGNSATTSKLKTAVTLWGQSFDGSKAITGNLTNVGTITPTGEDLKVVGNLIVTGGIVMYADDGATIESGFAALLAAHIDGVTIKYNEAQQKIYSVMTGIKVNGATYKPSETDGYITIPDYPTSLDWENIENKPSTFTPSSHTHTFASLTSKPTTLSGYGITDAKIANGVITLGTATITPLTAHQTVTLASGTNNGTLKLTVGSKTTDNIAVKGLGSAAYTASSAYAAASHTHSYLPLAGGTMTGGITFSNSSHLLWNSGSYHQRIFLTDDSTADTAVFTFQQSTDSGTNWSNLMVIRDNGKVIANTFVGALSGNASTASKWAAARKITLTGSVTGSVSIDGSGDVSLSTTTNHTHAYLPLAGGTMTGNIIIKGGTSADMTYAGNVHPYIRFDNSDSSQNVSLIFTDHDTYRSPAGIKLVGNQGNEWFEAANIYATTFYGALSGNATTATTATKLGTANVGSGTQHFYLNAGTATASTSTVGGTAKPMYLKAGVMTAISDTVGGTAKPIFLNAGTLTAISATVGSASKPVYLNGGSVTACSYDFTSYLPLSGGTMGGTAWIVWPDSGNWGNNNSGVTFPVTRGGLHWVGQSDWVKLYSQETGGDNLNLVLQFGDDNSNGLSIRNNGGSQTAFISATGHISAANGTVNGTLKVGAIPVTNSSTGVLKIDGNLIVTGGITMYATDGVASGLMEQILVDGTTIGKKADGTLYAINTGNVRSIIMGSTTYTPNDSGAVTLPEKVTWANIEGKPSSFTPSSHTHSSITIPVCSSLNGNSDVFSVEYAGGNNSVATKPSGVDAFGVMRLRTAAGWYGQIMMSANTAPGMYYRNANGLSSSVGWKKLLDSGNFGDYAAAKSHTHAISQITNLQATLDGKAAASHTHSYLPLSGGTMTGNILAKDIQGADNSNRIIFRHLDGQNCSGDYDLYLQYFHTSNVIYLNGSTYKIYNKGANYNGNAATATALSSVIANDKLPERLREVTTSYSGRDANTIPSNGFYYCTSNINGLGDANILQIAHTNSSWRHQLMFKFNGTVGTGTGYDGKDLWTRLYNGSSKTWTEWYRILTSGNFNAYALPITGGTVTGITTFNINNQWLTPSIIQIGRADTSKDASKAVIGVTDGNLHIDAYHNKELYLNYYNKGKIRLGYQTGSYYISENGSYYSGNSATATKLTSSAGSATLPIYFSDGKPVACTASSVFSNLSNSGNNISVTVAGQNRTLTVGYASNADTVDGYHASKVYNAPTFMLYNPNTSNTYILLATITISGTSLAMAEFTTLFQNRECLDDSSFILSGAIRRNSTTSVGATLSYITLHTGTPRNIYMRSDDGVTFRVYIQSAASAWTTYYRAIPIVDSGNITYSNTGTTSPISGSVLNIAATKGGNVNYANSAGSADTASKWQTARKITLTGSVTGSVSIDGSGDVTLATTTNHTHSYLPLAGGTMTGQIQRAGQGSSWIKGRDNAMIRVNSKSGYSVLSSIKTTNGSWEIGHYDASGYYNDLLFGYYTDDAYSTNNNSGQTKITFTSGGQVTATQFNGALSGNASSATKLQTARSIFGQNFDGSAAINGQGTFYGTYKSTANARYGHSALQIRENGLVTTNQSDLAYAPSIGFHWSGRTAATLLYGSDSIFYLRKQDFTTRASLDANLVGNASTASAVKDLTNSRTTYLDYAAAGVTSPSWLCAWNTRSDNTYEIRAISPANMLSVIKALPLAGGTLTGSLEITSGQLLISSGSDNKIVINNTDNDPYWSNIDFRQKNTSYGMLGTRGSKTLQWTGGDFLVTGGITMYSDLRKKNILSDEVLSVKEIAAAPLFKHTYKSDDNGYIHVGTSAQYWSSIHEDWFTRKDSEGYYQMELQNLGVAMGISLAREIVKYESKTDKKIKLMKKKINDLEARIKELEGSREERRTA